MLRAVITGGGTGIGRAQALALNKVLGATVFLAGPRKEPLEAVQREIGIDKCHVIADCDIGEIASWKKIVAAVEEIGGGELHFLGNTAGYAGPIMTSGYEAIAAEDLIRYNTSYISGVQLSYHFMAPFLIKGAQKRGSPSIVINLSSVNSTMPRGLAHLLPLYHPCKTAVDAITRTAYGLYKDKNLLSYSINPVVYETDMAIEGSTAMGVTLDQFAASFNPLPVKGDPADIGQISAALLMGNEDCHSSTTGLESGVCYVIMPLPPELVAMEKEENGSTRTAASSILFNGAALHGNLQHSLDYDSSYRVAWTKIPKGACFYSNGKMVPDEALGKIVAALEAQRLHVVQAAAANQG